MRRVFVAAAIVAAAGLAIAADRGAAEKQLKDAIKAQNQEGVQKACDALIDCGGKEAVTAVLAAAANAEGSIYWQLVNAAAGFQDKVALDAVGDFIVAKQGDSKLGLSRDLLFGLQNNASPFVAIPVGKVLDKGKYDLQLMAVDQLALSRSVDSIDALIASFKKEKDPELKKRLEAALKALSYQDLPDAAAWESWWKDQRPKGVPGKPAPGAAPANPGQPPQPQPQQPSNGGSGGTLERPRDAEFKTVEREDKTRVIVISSDRTGMLHGAAETPPGGHMVELDPWEFDKMQTILEGQRIPHTVVKKDDFEADPKKYLKDCYALLVNCARITGICMCPTCNSNVDTSKSFNRGAGCPASCRVHDVQTHRMKPETLKLIKSWVEDEGGFLYTEDMGMLEITQQLWGNFVGSGTIVDKVEKPNVVRQKNPNGTFEEHITVKLTPVRGNTSNPLMRGVWQKPRKDEVTAPAGPARSVERTDSPAKPLEHVWQVDDESPAIEIKDKARVTVLLESDDLAKIDGGFSAVAVTFKPGTPSKKQATGSAEARGTGEWGGRGGRVLHTMSHFGHQDTSKDGQALQNLIVNFLLEAAKAHDPSRG